MLYQSHLLLWSVVRILTIVVAVALRWSLFMCCERCEVGGDIQKVDIFTTILQDCGRVAPVSPTDRRRSENLSIRLWEGCLVPPTDRRWLTSWWEFVGELVVLCCLQ